jgi:polyisoprenoid-binding protein YceI
MSTSATTALPTGTWSIDPVHSSASFRVKHFGVSTFRSNFADVAGTYVGHGDHAHLTGEVAVESIAVTQPDFRAHLLAEDFFHAEQHPTIGYVADTVETTGDGTVRVVGDLTIRGATQRVEATGTYTEPGLDFRGVEHFGITLETTVDRRAFGLDWQAELPGGKLAAEYDVVLEVHLELTPQEA